MNYSYVKPRTNCARTNCSIDRIYTEIVPNATTYAPQTIDPIPFGTVKGREVHDCATSWNTAPLLDGGTYKENHRHREDSGVHTALNR